MESNADPPLKGAHQGQFIRAVQPAPGRQPLGKTGDPDTFKSAEEFGEVMTGGLPFDIRTESENDFPEIARFDTLHQFTDAEILGSDVVER